MTARVTTCVYFAAILRTFFCEVKVPDDDLQLEEIREGMAQELSRFRQKLNKAKSRIEELQTFYDETKTQIEELSSTDGIKGEYKNDIMT